jgi:hypothetical protein
MFSGIVQQKPEVTYIGDTDAGFQVVRLSVLTELGFVPLYSNSATDPHVTYSASILSPGDKVVVEASPIMEDSVSCVLDLDNYFVINDLFIQARVAAETNWKMEFDIHTQFLEEMGDIGLIVGG